ncbi:AcrR family transcriptional regulator [Clostridium tetanomorphum]|uniref:TetR/AcrR family transcriptional regulator n=1 Tax=Clostridium tetanomorphum TaxID=1553 RepID=A0A923J0B7_CLOTT|nr:TetR family transcriptional regulator [Clostridium tetanomorphum]KAJ51304.1 TetR family transcriptional regulator [Clostridium tetanomorphum DSM 665]MBC2397554.1 TetR/AcrR family transcriptional regulator [Clostridium tetanomorphum]MBP1863651.1 AcrR family transcriptional regulator [Clostridium tetanomorphum]NRS86227.1 AcrR family transcriptional regulator [Clostridium tetanomorphum]NRZ95694.1 AcrR family transcriptional regulator [Clostridium tetanomorphum]
MSPKVSKEYKEEKKVQLLQAARKVFIKKGYMHATMQDIMDEAGVSRGALYDYFNNIEHAFIEVLKFDDQEILHFFKLDDQLSIWIQLTKWIKSQQKSIETINDSLLLARAQFYLSSNYTKDKNNFPYIKERYQITVKFINTFIQKGIDKGEFHPSILPESIARYFISSLNGLMLDTFQLGAEVTSVHDQLITLIFSLKEMLCPIENK